LPPPPAQIGLSQTFSAKKKHMDTDKLAVYRQNFARVRLQFKFAFIIWPFKYFCILDV